MSLKWFFGNEVNISKLELNDGFVYKTQEKVIKNPREFRIIGPNIFSVQDDENIYFILKCKSKKFENYLAFSNFVPTIGKGLKCTRIISEYDTWREQNITTNAVVHCKKLQNNLYRMRSGHTYFVLVV